MGLIKKYFSNTRKPDGMFGKMMVSGMNKAHAEVSDWGMEHIFSMHPKTIIELGCGGGRNAARLLSSFPEATLAALDYSEVAIEKTKQINRKEIQNKRCHVLQGDVAALPFAENSFDLAAAFETVYFWPGPTESFREVWRVLKPGSLFLIVDGLRIFDKTQLSTFLKDAGFSKVTIDHDETKHRLCIMAVK